MGKKSRKYPPLNKYLDITLDPTLTFNHHVTTVIKTVLHKMTLLSKMKCYLTKDVATLIYKSMLLPYFDYVDVIYAHTIANNFNKLRRLQNRCLKICLGSDRRFSTDRAHQLTSTPILEDRRKAHILNFMYIRSKHSHRLNIREIRTRAHDAPLFLVDIPRCEAFKRSIGHFGAVQWNHLNPDPRNIDSYLVFKFLRRKDMLKPVDRIVLNNQNCIMEI